jgi:hypothetical protein
MADTAAIRDTALLLTSEATKREVSNNWHPSGRWTNCLRAAVYERAGIPTLRSLDVATLRMFEAGHEGHDAVKRHYDLQGRRIVPKGDCLACGKAVEQHHGKDEFHLYDEELAVSGYLDVLLNDEFSRVLHPGEEPWIAEVRAGLVSLYGTVPITAIEVKTIEPEEYVTSKDRGPMAHRMLQLALLKVVADRNPGQLPVVPESWELLLVTRARIRDNGELLTPPWLAFPLPESYVLKARTRIDVLNQAWAEKELPHCECSGPWRQQITTAQGRKLGAFCSYANAETNNCCEAELYETVTGAGSSPDEPGPVSFPAPVTPSEASSGG